MTPKTKIFLEKNPIQNIEEKLFTAFETKYEPFGPILPYLERISACFDAFLAIATIHIWINRILLVG